MELYGKCSYEAAQTYRAWQAVGINISPTSLPGYEYDVATTSYLINQFNDPFFTGVYISAMNQISANSNIRSISKPVIFASGKKIRLLPGFVSNKDFHAYICDQTPPSVGSLLQKSLGSNSGYDTNEENANKLQEKKDAIIIYPNPNEGAFTINTNVAPQEVISVQVFSMLGQSIYKQEGLPNNVIQLPQPTSGVFYVEVLTQTERFIRKMVVK